MMKKKYLSLILVPLSLLLTNCTDNENEKNLKNEIEITLNQKNNALCFYLGDVAFPYTAKTLIFPTDTRSDVWVNNELNRRLELFSRLGLLDRSFDTVNKTINYKLAKLNNDTEFRQGSFCFGKVSLDQFVIHNRKGTSVNASVSYTIDQIPLWVNDDTFTHYFYSQRLEDTNDNRYLTFDYSYPKLANKQFPNKLKSNISLVKLADGGFILDNTDAVWQSFYHNYDSSQWDKKHLTYAYYDASLATYLNQRSIRDEQLINTWGTEPDPVLLAKVGVSANLARSNNQVVMYSYFDHALTQNRIKSATGTIKNKLLGKISQGSSFEMYLGEDGLVSSFYNTTKINNFKNQRTISKKIDLKAETITWKFYDYFTASIASRNQDYMNPFATDDYSKTDLFNIYQADYTNKLTRIAISENEFIPVSVSYDTDDRILSFDDNMTFKYNDKNHLFSLCLEK